MFLFFIILVTIIIDVMKFQIAIMLFGISLALSSVKNNVLVDSYGRQRLYHGMNVVYKSAPYAPMNGVNSNPRLSFDVNDAALLNKLGQNVIRLGVMWPGVEPVKGTYNMTYIQEIRNIVNICNDYDISVVFEFHQDGFSEMFCGEGVPYWAAHNVGINPWFGKFPWPADGITNQWAMKPHENQKGEYVDHKIPSKENCAKHDWGQYLFSYATAKNYEWFYNNEHGLRDSFAEYFALLAREFKDDKNVIAFELLNEPSFTWSVYIYPGLTDLHFLQPFYDAVANRIHQEDASRVILFEPTTWSNEYPDCPFTRQLLKSRLKHAPGGQQYSNVSVLAYHYYPWVNKAFDDTSPESYFKSRVSDQNQLGVAGFVTEWNLESVENQGDDSSKRMNQLLDVMDEHQLSWMAWTYKGYLPTEEQTDFVPTCTGCGSGLIRDVSATEIEINWQTAYTIARTYAQAVQGVIKSMKFNSETNEFFLSYLLDPSIEAPTIIYINTELDEEGTVQARHDINRLQIEIEPADVVDFNFDGDNLIYIQSDFYYSGGITEVRVHIWND